MSSNNSSQSDPILYLEREISLNESYDSNSLNNSRSERISKVSEDDVEVVDSSNINREPNRIFCIKNHTKHNIYNCYDKKGREWRYYTDYHTNRAEKLICADLNCKGRVEITSFKKGTYKTVIEHSKILEKHSYYISKRKKELKKKILQKYV